MKKHLVAIKVCLLVAACLTVLAGIFQWDAPVYALKQAHPSWLNTLAINITFMGDAFFAFGLILYFIFFVGNRKLALDIFFGTMGCLILVQLTKNIFSGGTLTLFFERGQYIFSAFDEFSTPGALIFPSSHVALALTLGCILADYYPKFRVLFIAGIVAVIGSRAYLAGESPFNLLGGLTIGLTIHVFTPLLTKYLRYAYNWKPVSFAGRRKYNEEEVLPQMPVSA